MRLHYVYPYPHVDAVVAQLGTGGLLPYLDIPLQHAVPHILKAMRRPAHAERTLERVRRWRERCPDLCIRSTFIVGFPGESDQDLATLLDFLDEAALDRVGCFTYSNVTGAAANAYPAQVDERVKLERQEIVLEHQSRISAERMRALRGRSMQVLVDRVAGGRVTARSWRDAPEVDGTVTFSTTLGSSLSVILPG